MLLEIIIKNYVIIDYQVINLESGLNVITGETGSGKSLIIDALSAITGGRFNKEDIRSGESKASIEALFSIDNSIEVTAILEEYGIEMESDNSLVITREVNTRGKSVCRINGQMVTVSILRKVAQYLLDIVGQNEHQLLFNTMKHIDLVDNFGVDEIKPIKDDLRLLIENYSSLQHKLESICINASERERKLDLLRFQIEEINNAGLRIGEDEELKSRRHLLINAEKLFKGVSNLYNSLFNGVNGNRGVSDSLNDCTSSMKDLAEIDNKLESYKTSIENIVYQLEDIKGELRTYLDGIEFNDSEIDSLEERLDQINKLKRKYGSSIENVLSFRDDASKEYSDIIDSEELLLKIENNIKEIKEQYKVKARLLSENRKKLASKLEKLIERELNELNMCGSRFVIKIIMDENTISINGFDKIEFFLSPNPGEPEKPLSKIASGGEMSRVMLAMRNAYSEIEKATCLVFDEIDAGVGGQTANMVGQKIKLISKNSQILCITHLPQIARLSDNHIFVEKILEDNKTFTKIKILDTEERVKEIARMFGGDENIDASLEHAKKIIGEM